ncbi:discoidin domain-containing protein [Streptomyces sp. NPDC001404]|uniref:discoidin domain-containing protein n=1 Tax=Streptomyces sp. NPDC001404 TaxID=3364571 RepID=UPI003699CC36
MARHAHTPGVREPCPGCESPVGRGEVFCGACGAYLDWTATPAEPPDATQVLPPVPRQRTPRHRRQDEQEPRAPRPARDHRPTTLLPPGDEPRAEQTLRLFAVKDTRDTGTPPLACPSPGCGRDNPQERHFCRHCGELLRPPPEPEHLPWWRRIVEDARTRIRERPAVWHRNRSWYVLAGAGGVGLVVVLAGGGPWLAGPAVTAAGRVQDRFAAKTAVVPDTVSASSERDGFAARCAADGVNNRAWAPKNSGADARGQWWEADFGQPFRLTSLVILNGVSQQPKDYLAAGRPHRLKAVAITADDRAFVKDINLADQPGPQTFGWGVDDVRAVRLQIEDVRVDDAAGAKAPVGLAEVQFFTRKG